MQKIVVSFLALSAFSSAAVLAVAQSDCSAVFNEDGQLAYEQCQRKNREQTIQQQMNAHKERVTAEQDRIKAYYKRLSTEVEHVWNQFNNDRQWGIGTLEYTQSREQKNSDNYQRNKDRIQDIKAEQKFLKRLKSAEQDMLDIREEMELQHYNLLLLEYEASLRGFPRLFSQRR